MCARTAIGTKGIGLIPKDAMTTCYAKMLLKLVSKSGGPKLIHQVSMKNPCVRLPHEAVLLMQLLLVIEIATRE